jgi:flagellar basal-body rod protein FlgB
MDPTRHGPAHLAEDRLRWLDARQRVLAQNIANADTPGYQPRDVAPFREVLARARPAAPMALTDAAHLPPTRGEASGRVAPLRTVAERTRDGNSVALDREALKVAETDNQHALATGLRRKYLDLFRTSLGRP